MAATRFEMVRFFGEATGYPDSRRLLLEKSLTFFRVFSIAFFAPGMLLLALVCALLNGWGSLAQPFQRSANIRIAHTKICSGSLSSGLAIHSIV